ncbi:MAG: GCN5-related N-acetyltransferase [Flavipsychrobacter sp.]|jgi:GNAT superfamily N-acetyltransferase|nr:GCN5-related N-acetyltransferase [Flavipsychrobacter sp.]
MLHYRKAILTDITSLVSLRIEFLKEVMHTDTPANDISAGLEQYFTAHLQQGDYINWLALDGDTIIGTGGICFYSIPPNFFNPSGDRAYILNVYTLPAYRRRGISKEIFSRLMSEAEQRNVRQVSLHATPDGAALYEQFGFKPKGNEMVWGKHI